MTSTVTLPDGWRSNRAVAARVRDTLLATVRHVRPPQEFASPGDLARALDPGMRQTPALQLIDDALAKVASGAITRLIISMPPQEGKSERATHYGVLWSLMRNPTCRAAIVSYSDAIARNFSYKIRNDVLTFTGDDGGPDLGLRVRTDSRATGYWQLASGGSVAAVGIGSSLTSRAVDLMIIDDPVKDYRAADSETVSDATWLWWQSVARPRLPPGAPVILILTRWSEKDLAGRLLAEQRANEAAGLSDYDRWTELTISAKADFDPAKGETDPLGREPGEYMISARDRTDADWRKTEAASGSRAWNALYQGRPSPGSGNVWLRQWWRRYVTPLWTTDGETRRTIGMDEVFTSWDMTFKESKGSDYVVGTVWGRRGAQLFLLDRVRDRMSFTETLAAVERLVRKWPDARFHLIEDKANGPAALSMLREKMPGLIPIEPRDSKFARASAVSPFIESGSVLLPAPELVDWDTEELVDEAAVFPNGAHDDQVDSISQAVARAFIDGTGAAAWMAWMDRKIAAGTVESTDTDTPVEVESPEPTPEPVIMAETPVPETTDAERRQAARNAMFQR